MLRTLSLLVFLACALLSGACGSRSEAPIQIGTGKASDTSTERCNGLDDDGKRGVDDPFRDEAGRYVSDQHCGACNQPCAARPESEREAHCRVVDGLASCVAESCQVGYAATKDGHCARVDERLCLPCAGDTDCGSLVNARCASIAGESRCTISCTTSCPSGTSCDVRRGVCVPSGGSCSCKVGQKFAYACALDDVMRGPDAGVGTCVGSAQCDNGRVTVCSVPEETCDEQDNDCDGRIDEGFRDQSGTYSLDPAHCGQCGASCLEDTGVDQKLVCGGDPFAPRCALACPDALNGIAPGDRLDGDLDLATGCECVVQKVADVPGPLLAKAELLDENCDGADGNVRESFYVASDGNDAFAGSPTRPLRTIGAAVMRAALSLQSSAPRPHIYIASGSYTETITLMDGVSLHGGYRRDFRALDPAAFTVEVRAPRGAAGPSGAALVAVDVGQRATTVQWLTLRGLDAEHGGAAVGAYVERPGALLAFTDMTIQAGVPGEGASGSDGAAGGSPSALAGAGEAPRAAREDATHRCISGNATRGGSGGRAVCGAIDVRGGDGGQAGCPVYASFQGAGTAGRAASGGSGGAGGSGGQDSSGPIDGDCPGNLCCGLADFSVPTNFQGPRPGDNGIDGVPGNGGEGCSGGDGRFVSGVWSGGSGSGGSDGLPGAGGGGGGSGGGAEITFDARFCAFEDGLGGGGGGGGAGGCGGRGGQGGINGAPSVALLVVSPRAFLINNVIFRTTQGGRGGAGGAGGSGAAGGNGAAGGQLAMAARITPTLAGPFPGARGGSGGAGGSGGGAGGGCGGASAGIWVVGSASSVSDWQARNAFQLGAGGAGGVGGGGARSGKAGTIGRVANVIAQI